MILNKLTISDLRLFERLEIDFANTNNIAVIVGVNGAGKSTILDAIAYTMAHIIGNLVSPSDAYKIEYSLGTDDIRFGEKKCEIEASYNGFGKTFSINALKEINFEGSSHRFSDENLFERITKKLLDSELNELPLMAYYRVNRSWDFDTKEQAHENSYRGILNGFNGSLNSNLSTFTDFENWYLDQENIENELRLKDEKLQFELPSLSLVRVAISKLFNILEGYKNFTIKGNRILSSDFQYKKNKNGYVTIEHNDESLKLSMLSSGQKSIILLVADIARRLTILNNNSKDALLGKGVVLIDEIEMHLHPSWQRKIVGALRGIFPNIQFIICTHSPQVISEVKNDNIYLLDEKKIRKPNTNPLGGDSNGILKTIFDTTERPENISILIDEIFSELNSKNITKSKSLYQKLSKLIGERDPIRKRIESFISRFEKIDS